VTLQLIEAGHTPKEAEAWANDIGPFHQAPHDDVSLFVAALTNVWEEISTANPEGWRANVAAAAREWAVFRGVE
jgi:hypothetical protein